MTNTKYTYIDTSAYLSILLGEKNADKLAKKLERKALCSSVFLFLEAERNLIRLSRENKLSMSQFSLAMEHLKKDVDLFLLKDVTIDLCFLMPFPPVRTPRSADLAHLRTALWFLQNGYLNDFLSLDKNQIAAAEELNLPIFAYGI